MNYTEIIELQRFDNYWKNKESILDYVKIDVEGHELDVLEGFGDLIKNTVTTTFNRGQDNQVAELVKVCEQFGFKYLQKQKVEPMTLKAFAKEQVEKGKELPFDLFGIYIANKAKLKTKE